MTSLVVRHDASQAQICPNLQDRWSKRGRIGGTSVSWCSREQAHRWAWEDSPNKQTIPEVKSRGAGSWQAAAPESTI